MTLPLQDVLEGKYEILEKIGEGGIGAVYKVRHRLLEEIRVIKVLRPEAASKKELRERFLLEAQMAIRLKHPNIAQLHDFSIAEDDRAYIVMEFIDGVALDALLETSGPPSVDLTLEISRQALEALDYLHQHDFVHRDVSPDNLMLATAFDGSPLVKLIDLGIARHLGAEGRLTATGVFIGKARYCSPEHFSAGGDAPVEVDRRGDVYSYGVLLYELLTGVYPFAGENFAELAGSHLFQPPREFADSDPAGRLPAGLRQAVLRALEKAPEDRYATAAEFAAALAPFRDPNAMLRDEFDRTVEIVTAGMPKPGERQRPGSTQDRLNAQFGVRKASAGDAGASDALRGKTKVGAPARSLAGSVRRIERLIARGRARPAARAFERAVAIHGQSPELVELRPAVERLATADGRRWPGLLALVAGGLAVAAVAAGALWWWLGRQPLAEQQPAERPDLTEPLTVPATPSWDPAAVIPSPSLPGAAEIEPPPAEPPTEPAGPVSGAPPAEPEVEPEPLPPAEPAPETAEEPAPEVEQLVVTQQLFEPGVGVVPPVLLALPRPRLPDDARSLKDELTVVVKVLVDETGKVSRALIGSGPSFRRHYRDAALAAAEGASFRPARKGDVVGRMWAEVHVTFQPE